MRLHDLLRTERLMLSAVSVPPGALDREVTGAYITDLPDPSRFLSVGDVVLTSGMWIGAEGAVENFVSALVRQRVVALVLGLVHVGHVPEDLLAACRREGLTILTISDKVSFKEVVAEVASAQPGQIEGIAEKALRFNRRLAEVLARGDGASAVLQELHVEFAIGCWVVDAIGTLVAVAGTAPSRAEVGRTWNLLLGRDDEDRGIVIPAENGTWAGGDAVERTSWPIRSTDGTVAGYLVCNGDQRQLARSTPIIVDSVRGAVRVDLEFAARWRERSHSHVSELVRVIAEDSVSPGEISARMRLEGLDPQEPTVVAVAEVADERFPAGAVLEMTQRVLARDEMRIVGAVVADRAVLLLSGRGAGEIAAGVPSALVEDSLPMLGGRQLRIGASDARTGVGGLAAAYAVARDRLAHLQSVEPVALASSSELSTHRALLAQLSDRGRADFARDVLRPLREYDSRQGADLVATLRVFLANTGAWQESARQLHLHTNTLRYRIARVEELTGRSMGAMEDRVDFFLALQIESD